MTPQTPNTGRMPAPGSVPSTSFSRSYLGPIQACDGSFVTSTNFANRRRGLRRRARKELQRLRALAGDYEEPLHISSKLQFAKEGQEAMQRAWALRLELETALLAVNQHGGMAGISASAPTIHSGVSRLQAARPEPIQILNTSVSAANASFGSWASAVVTPGGASSSSASVSPVLTQQPQQQQVASPNLSPVLVPASQVPPAPPPLGAPPSSSGRVRWNAAASDFRPAARPLAAVASAIEALLVQGSDLDLHAARASGLLGLVFRGCAGFSRAPEDDAVAAAGAPLLVAALASLRIEANHHYVLMTALAAPVVKSAVELLDSYFETDSLFLSGPAASTSPAAPSVGIRSPGVPAPMHPPANGSAPTPAPPSKAAAAAAVVVCSPAPLLELQLALVRGLLTWRRPREGWPSRHLQSLTNAHEASVAYAMAAGIIYRIHDLLALFDRPAVGPDGAWTIPSYLLESIRVLDVLTQRPASERLDPPAGTGGGSTGSSGPSSKRASYTDLGPRPPAAPQQEPLPAPGASHSTEMLHPNVSGVLVFFHETSLVRLTSFLTTLLLQASE